MKEQGSLSVEKLEDLFKDLPQNHFAGILAAYDEKSWKEFYFTPQGIRVTSVGAKKSLPVGEIMLRQCVVDSRAVDKTLERMREKPGLFGEMMVDLRLADEEQVQKALVTQAELELLDLYFWKRPTFEYTPGMQSIGSLIVERKRRETDTRSLSLKCHPLDVIKGVRAAFRDVTDMKARIGRSDLVFTLTDKGREKLYDTGGFAKLGAIDQRVIVQIDGRNTILDLFRKARVMWMDVMRVVDKLMAHGAVDAVDDGKSRLR